MVYLAQMEQTLKGTGGQAPGNKYAELVEAIIKKQIMIIGATMVLEAVQKLKDIQVGADGAVLKISGDPKKAVSDLIGLFRDLYGSFGEISCKKAAKEILEKYPELEVPGNLR